MEAIQTKKEGPHQQVVNRSFEKLIFCHPTRRKIFGKNGDPHIELERFQLHSDFTQYHCVRADIALGENTHFHFNLCFLGKDFGVSARYNKAQIDTIDSFYHDDSVMPFVAESLRQVVEGVNNPPKNISFFIHLNRGDDMESIVILSEVLVDELLPLRTKSGKLTFSDSRPEIVSLVKIILGELRRVLITR